jgi:dTMP kinase
MPRPDAMIFIDLDPETAMERAGSRGNEREMFENLGSMKEMRERILSVPGLTVIDGSGTPEETAERMMKAMSIDSAGNIF